MKPISFVRSFPAGILLLPIAVLAAPSATTNEATPHFDIWEYRVFGNTVLDTNSIQKIVYPFLGPGRSIDDVEKARQVLEETYHKAGYQTVFVNIPEQDVEAGLVRLDVVEGKVDRLKITGSRYYSLGHIRESVPALAEGTVPHMPSVQKQLTQLATESSTRQITPVLRTSNIPGMFDAELKVKDQLPVHGSLEMNGRNSTGTSYSRLIASLQYDNLWQLNHSASLQYQVAPEKQDVEVWSGTYAMPIQDMRLAFYGVGVSSTAVVNSAFGVLGTGNIFGLRLAKPLKAIDDYFHSVTFGVDYKSFNQDVLGIKSPISYVPFMVAYGGGYRHDNGLTTFDLQGHASFRNIGNHDEQFQQRHSQSKTNFFYLSGNIKHEHTLPGDFLMSTRIAGQIASAPLISNEQLSAGGAYSVRGYHETQELGDNGVVGSLELQSLQLAPKSWDFVQNLRALTFIDGAKVWTKHPALGTPSQVSLASTGIGMRLAMSGHWHGELDWAYPLIPVGAISVGDQRIHFRFAYEF